MYAIVVGGGKVGYYLAKELINQGHEVLIIEKDRQKSDHIAEELGSVVMRGDGCEAAVLAQAGANRADVVIAVTGDDEDNLVVCQMAKAKFDVQRAIARINNPKNEGIFRLLGVDATVSHTDVILAQIEERIPTQPLLHLMRQRDAGLEIVEAKLTDHSPVVGQKVKDLPLPPETKLLLIIRGKETVIPVGDTVPTLGDEVIAITREGNEEYLRQLLMGAS
ncbi:MAG: TrkA family potassium uptake protein [Dehalococcoidales bacterium]|nr:TrkA family potassium uptake protein [Dehalococcoidales bacterium]